MKYFFRRMKLHRQQRKRFFGFIICKMMLIVSHIEQIFEKTEFFSVYNLKTFQFKRFQIMKLRNLKKILEFLTNNNHKTFFLKIKKMQKI